MSKAPWGRPSLPGVSGPCPRPAVPTSCPGRLGPMSQGPRGRPAVPGNSDPVPRSHGLDQMSWATWCRVPVPARSTSWPGRPRPVSLGPRSRPAAPGDSGPCLRSRGLDQMSQATGGLVPVPAGLTSCPRRLGRGSRVSGIHPHFRATRARVRGPQVRPAVPEDTRPAPIARGVDQLSVATQASVRGLTMLTSCPRRLGPGSEVPRVRPAQPGDTRSYLRARDVAPLSWATRARVERAWG